MDRIRFKGNEYLLIGIPKYGAAIATPEQYKKGMLSFAALMPNGNIISRGELIGSKDDIEVIEKDVTPPEPELDAVLSILGGQFTDYPGV